MVAEFKQWRRRGTTIVAEVQYLWFRKKLSALPKEDQPAAAAAVAAVAAAAAAATLADPITGDMMDGTAQNEGVKGQGQHGGP